MIRRATLAATCAVILLSATGCSRSEAANDGKRTPPFDPRTFLSEAMMSANSNIEIAGLAHKRTQRPDTLQLAALLARQQTALRQQLAVLAGRKQVGVSNAVKTPRAALRDNLAILMGQKFDQGFAIGTIQDLNSVIKLYEAAASGSDPDVAKFASAALPTLQQEQRTANDLLTNLGGSPFGYPP